MLEAVALTRDNTGWLSGEGGTSALTKATYDAG